MLGLLWFGAVVQLRSSIVDTAGFTALSPTIPHPKFSIIRGVYVSVDGPRYPRALHEYQYQYCTNTPPLMAKERKRVRQSLAKIKDILLYDRAPVPVLYPSSRGKPHSPHTVLYCTLISYKVPVHFISAVPFGLAVQATTI